MTNPSKRQGLLEAAQKLIASDYGAYAAQNKPESEWDEYDTMVIPLWRALIAAAEREPALKENARKPNDADLDAAAKVMASYWAEQLSHMDYPGEAAMIDMAMLAYLEIVQRLSQPVSHDN